MYINTYFILFLAFKMYKVFYIKSETREVCHFISVVSVS